MDAALMRRSSSSSLAGRERDPLWSQAPSLFLFTALALLVAGRSPASPLMNGMTHAALVSGLALALYAARPQIALPLAACLAGCLLPVAQEVCRGVGQIVGSILLALFVAEPFVSPNVVSLVVLLGTLLISLPPHWTFGTIAFTVLWSVAIYAASTFHNRARGSRLLTVAVCLTLPGLGVLLLGVSRKEADLLRHADRIVAYLVWFCTVTVCHLCGGALHRRLEVEPRLKAVGCTIGALVFPAFLWLLLAAAAHAPKPSAAATLMCILDALRLQLMLFTIQLSGGVKSWLGWCCIASLHLGTWAAGYTPYALRLADMVQGSSLLFQCLGRYGDPQCWDFECAVADLLALTFMTLYNLCQPFLRQELHAIPEALWSVEYNTFHVPAPDPPAALLLPTSAEVHRLRQVAAELPRRARQCVLEEEDTAHLTPYAVQGKAKAAPYTDWHFWEGLASLPTATLLQAWERLLRLREPPSSKAELFKGCYRTWRIKVDRRRLLRDALRLLWGASEAQLCCYRLQVEFAGEEGLDLGGVSREFFASCSAELARPENRLFEENANAVWRPCYTDNYTAELERAYVAVGRLLGMAIMQGQCLDVYLPTLLYKMLLGQPLTARDTKELDPQLYRNRFELLLEDGGVRTINDALGEPLRFVCLEHPSGTCPPLEPGGADRLVTEENKLEYLEKLGAFYVFHGCEAQFRAILLGFWAVIPLEVLESFGLDARDLQLILTGVPALSVTEWQKHTTVARPKDHAEVQLVEWFFTILQTFGDEQRARLLAFSTGASKLPPSGFQALNFHLVIDRDPQHLPTSNTCTSTLYLPLCPTLEALRQRLLYVVQEDVGFGFALT